MRTKVNQKNIKLLFVVLLFLSFFIPLLSKAQGLEPDKVETIKAKILQIELATQLLILPSI